MSGITVIRAAAIDASLAGTFRQYLVGHLERRQDLEHVEDDGIELGVSSYAVAAPDVPHVHPVAREYMYVIAGVALVRDLWSGALYRLAAGDLYVVDPGVPHAQKNASGTRILFVKHPAGNDKVEIEADQALSDWLADLSDGAFDAEPRP